MSEDIKTQADILANTRTGWVDRRDAALALGQSAAACLGALKRHAEDADVDVRTAVGEALKAVHLPVAPDSSGAYSLSGLAQACERKGRREVQQDGDDFIVRVVLSEGRAQQVRLSATKGKDGTPLYRAYTLCGTPDDKTKAWCLRNNAKLVHCAFAVLERDGQEQLVLLNNIPQAHATPEGVKAAVKEIAYYGDWLENRLTGEDVY
jgi:hypothetical protein